MVEQHGHILNGEADKEIDLAVTRAVEKGMKDAGKTVEVKTYPKLGHDDLCGDKAYLADLIDFIKKHHGPQ